MFSNFIAFSDDIAVLKELAGKNETNQLVKRQQRKLGYKTSSER